MKDDVIEKGVVLIEEYAQKKEKLAMADKSFLQVLESYLKQRPELKKQYDDKLDKNINEIKKQKTDINFNVEEEKLEPEQRLDIDEKIDAPIEEKKIEEKIDVVLENLDIKKIYRAIVKITHPDKLAKKGYTENQMKKLVEHYSAATKAYDDKDLLNLIRIAAILYLPLNLTEESLEELESKIIELKQKIAYIETTFAWMWYHAPTEIIKDQMLQLFLAKMLNKNIR